jgi:hypothetical protein
MDAQGWWDEVVWGSLAGTWMSHETHRYRAISNVYDRLKEKGFSFESFPPMIIFAPAFDTMGLTIGRTVPPNLVLVYLSPMLELEPQWDIDFTVAHEFAHVLLDGGKLRLWTAEEMASPYKSRREEVAADALALEWGFRQRRRGDPSFMRLLGGQVSAAARAAHKRLLKPPAKRPRTKGQRMPKTHALMTSEAPKGLGASK